MTPQTIQLIVSGGASTVLFWLVWQFLRGDIYSKAAHDAIIGPLKEANASLRQELREQTSTSAQAVIAQQESTRQQMAELTRTNAELVAAIVDKAGPT
jgi:hypothetical protein